jgi:hypothetical protein
LVDVRVLARPAVAVPNVSGFCIGFLMYASFTLLSDVTQTPGAVGYGFGAPILHSGILLPPTCWCAPGAHTESGNGPNGLLTRPQV